MLHDRPLGTHTSQEKDIAGVDRALTGLLAHEDMSEQENVGTTSIHGSDRIEITQQQVSRSMALVLVGSFLLFLAGYTLGKYHVVQSTSEGAKLIPDLVYGMFFERVTEEPLIVPHKEVHGEYSRFATFEEADKLCRELKKRGILTQVVTRSSSTVNGRRFVHYAVCKETQKELISSEPVVEKVVEKDMKKGGCLND